MNLYRLATEGIDLDALPLEESQQPRASFQFEPSARTPDRLRLPSELDDVFNFAAQEYGVDVDVLRGIAYAESRFNPDIISGKVKSPAGAIGLMQFMPETAKEYGIDPTDPVQSIIGGAAYLRKSLDKFGGDYERAVASYNWGPNRKAYDSEDWSSKAPAETQKYLMTVFDAAGRFKDGAAERSLPAGVEPSKAGAGRGVVSPGMVNTQDTQVVAQPVDTLDAKLKKQGEFSPLEESGKGLQSGYTGLKQMWESNKVLKDAVLANSMAQRLSAFDRIDAGATDVPRAIGLAYQQADANGRAKIRGDVQKELSSRQDFISASMETIRQYQAEQQRTKGRTTDLTDVGNLKDFGNWLAFNGASGVVSMAPLMVAAVATGPAAPLVAGAMGYVMATGELTGDRIQHAQGKLSPQRFLRNPDRYDDAVRAENQNVTDYVAKTAGSTVGAAVPFAALDVVAGPVGSLLKGAGKEAVEKGAKWAAKEIGKDTLEEGATGGAQEVIKILTENALGEQDGILTGENLKRVINSAAAEAAGGMVGGGARVGYQAATRQAPTVESQPTTPQAPTVTPQAPVTPDAAKTQAVDNIAAAILEAEGGATQAAPVQAGQQTVDAGTAPVAQGATDTSGGLATAGEAVAAGQPEQAQSLTKLVSAGVASVDPATGVVVALDGVTVLGTLPQKESAKNLSTKSIAPVQPVGTTGEGAGVTQPTQVQPTQPTNFSATPTATVGTQTNVQAGPGFTATGIASEMAALKARSQPKQAAPQPQATGLASEMAAIKSRAKNQSTVQPLLTDEEAEMLGDFERLYQADIKGEIRDRLGLTPKPEEVQATQARRSSMTPFKAFLRDAGISSKLAQDITGANAMEANRKLPGAFRKNGLNLDLLVQRAKEEGFMSQADEDSNLDNGGVNQLVKLIQQEFAGTPVQRIENVAQDMEATATDRARAELDDKAMALGLGRAALDLPTERLANIIGRIERRLGRPVRQDFETRKMLRSEINDERRAILMTNRIERARAQYDADIQAFAESSEGVQDAVLEIVTDADGNVEIVYIRAVEAAEAADALNGQWSDQNAEVDTRRAGAGQEDSGQAGAPVAQGARAGTGNPEADRAEAGAGAQEAEGLNDGITIRNGKGLIKGKFLADLDGDGVPGGPWNTEQEARTAAEAYRKTKAQNADRAAQDQRQRDYVAGMFRDGKEVSNAQLEGIGFDPYTTDMRDFMGKAARLFGLNSRQIRPLVTDQIKIRRSDMGVEYEYVNTRKALQAVADSQRDALTTYTPAEVTARQDAAAEAEATAKRAEDAAARAEAAAKQASEIAQRSVAAADTFELGQSAEDNLSGQMGLKMSRRANPRTAAIKEMLAAEAALDEVRKGDPNKVTLESWMALSDRSLKAKKALTAELAKIPDDGFALQAQASGGRSVILTPSAQQPGRWQLTRFDANGAPWGDTNYDTKEQALRDFIDEADLSTLVDGAGLKFSKAAAKEVRNLVTLHNLSKENLLYAGKMGGIPVPSIGITKVDSPFGGFGNITLIAPKGMIDPESGVPVYDRDAWTARFPTLNFKKVKAKVADAFYERMKPAKEMGNDGQQFLSMLWEEMRNASVQRPDKIISLFTRYDAARLFYAKEVLGKTLKMPMRPVKPRVEIGHDKILAAYWAKNGEAFDRAEQSMSGADFAKSPEKAAFNEAIREAIERDVAAIDGTDGLKSFVRKSLTEQLLPEGGMNMNMHDRLVRDFKTIGQTEIDGPKLRDAVRKLVPDNDPAYLKWVSQQVEPLFEAPTITVRGREVPVTLDNIVDAMTVGATAGAEKSMTFSPGKVAAMLGKQFKSIDEIKAARDQVVSAKVESEGKKTTDALLDEYRAHVSQFYTHKDWRGNVDTWAANDDSMEALAKAGKLPASDANIRGMLSRMGFKGVDQRGVDLARQSIEALRNAATDYFEAKPQRAVKLDEFKGAVVPKGTSPEALALLEQNGIAVEMYGKAEGAREQAIQKLSKRIDKQRGDVLFSKSNTAPATLVADIRTAITKAYGNLLTRLEGKGLVSLTQTEEEAIAAAAQARADQNGGDVEAIKESLRKSVLASQRAWHGTPHRGIEKFSTDKIGTGEGAQAYGWGLYFADKRGVAEYYREALAGKQGVSLLDANGDVYSPSGAGIDALVATWLGGNKGNYKATRDMFDGMYSDQPEYGDMLAELDRLESSGVKVNPDSIGQLYEVEIPEDSEMLLWDKPLSEQPEKARESLRYFLAKLEPFVVAKRPDFIRLNQRIADGDITGAALYKDAQGLVGSDRLVSKILASIGIKGIKYLDGTSRGAGEGSYNYVIFSGDDVQIVDVKYSKDGNLEGFFDPATGKSFLIADNLTAESAPATLMHEVGIHMAADGKLEPLFDRAAKLLKMGKGNAFLNRVQNRLDEAGETSAEEAAAYIVTEYEKDRTNAPASVTQWIKDFIADVRAWLFNKGVLLKADSLTVADIAAVARANANRMARGGDVAADGERMFSKQASTDLFTPDVLRVAVADSNNLDPFIASPIQEDVQGVIPGKPRAFDRWLAMGRFTEHEVKAKFKNTLDLLREKYGDALTLWRADAPAARQSAENRTVFMADRSIAEAYANNGRLAKAYSVKTDDILAVYARPSGYYEVIVKVPEGGLVERVNNIEEFLASTDQTETPEFKRWFGDSKVVDADGKPLVVYHGTVRDFSAFAKKGVQPNFTSPQKQLGFFFTDDPSYADRYTKRWGEFKDGANTIPVYLSLQNPKVEPIEKIGDIEDRMKQGEAKAYRAELEAQGFDGIVFEGETPVGFVREFVAFRPEQIKSAIGNNGQFDPANPDIRRSVRGGGQQQAPVVTTWDDLGASKMDALIYEGQDDRIDLKRVQENIVKAGRQIREEFDARMAETLFPGRVAKRNESFVDQEVKPLLQAMAASNVSMEELGDYLLARHAPERNEQIAKINPGMPDGGAGTNSHGVLMTTQAANDYIANLSPGKRTALQLLAKRVDTITKGTRDLLITEGLEKASTVAAWEGAYKNYVPLFKDEAAETPGHPVGSGFSVKGGASKRAMGSTKEVTNVLAHVLMQREAAITRAEKNRVGMSLYGLALSNPNKEFWSTVVPKMSTPEIIAELQSMGVNVADAFAGMEATPTIRYVDPITGLVTERPNPVYKNLDNALVVKVGGEDRVILFNTKNERAMRLVESLKNQNRGSGVFVEATNLVAPVTRFMASMLTQYNPAFGMVNAVRDVQGALVNLSSTELKGQQAKVLAAVPAAMKGIARDLRGDKARTQWSDLWVQFQEDGGRTGIRDLISDPYEKAGQIEKDLKRLSKAGKLTPGNAAHAVLDLLSDFNDTLENGVRLAAYKTAIDQGMSQPAAAKLARELTVDFNRKGRTGRELGKLYAFLNASIQGSARTIQTLKGPMGAKIMAGGFALGVLQAFMLAWAGFDDDDIPEFIKSRNLIIPMGGDRYVTIPLALGLHVLPNTGRAVTELVMSGGKDIGEKSLNTIVEIVTAFNPFGGGGDWKSAHGPLTMVTPTVMDPVIDMAMNRDFTGRQISKERRNPGDVRPGATMARESTKKSPSGQVYIGISEAINTAMGGTDVTKGAWSPTPEELRYMATVVGGGVYRETERAINAAVLLARGEEVKPHQVPLGSRFAGEVDDEMSTMSRYYKNDEKLNKFWSEFKAEAKDGNTERVEEMKRDPRFAAAAMNNKIEQSITKLNKLAGENVSDKEKYEAINKKRAELMKKVNEAVKEAEKQ